MTESATESQTGGSAVIRPSLGWALPMMLGLLVVAASMGLNGFWELDHATLVAKQLATDIERNPVTDRQLMARYGLAAASLFFLAAALAALMQACRQIRLNLEKEERFSFAGRWKARRVVFGFACFFGLALFGVVEFKPEKLRESLMPEAFNQTLAWCSAKGCAENGPISDGSFLDLLDRSVLAGNLLSTLISVFVAVAACCIVIRAQNLKQTDKEAARVVFLELAARWKTLLYFAAAFLVSGIIFVSAWRSWPAAYLQADSPTRSAFQAAVDGSVLFEGLAFTIILFAIFFSAAAAVNNAYTSRGLAKGDGEGEGEGLDLSLKSFGDLLTQKDFSKTGIAILSPFLSGLLPLVMEVLGKAPG